jgi:hypothetical protein
MSGADKNVHFDAHGRQGAVSSMSDASTDPLVPGDFGLRPKTPPMPHHFDTPERHILEFIHNLASKPSSASNERVPSISKDIDRVGNIYEDGVLMQLDQIDEAHLIDAKRTYGMPPGRYKNAELVGKVVLDSRRLFWDIQSLGSSYASYGKF